MLDRGTTLPLRCLLEDEEGRSSAWVVKLPEKRRPMALVAEALGSLLVELVGLRNPATGFLVLPTQPLRLSQADEWLRLDEAIEQHAGEPAFCSQFVRNAVEHTAGMESRQEPLGFLALFVVDAFMWHFDRTNTTPNILWDENQLIAIDHGRAFFKMEAVDENGASERNPAEHFEENWPNHVMFEYLRRQFTQGRLQAADVYSITARLCACLTGQSILERIAWLEALAATHLKADIAYFLKKRVAAVDDLTEKIANVLASR